MFEIITYCVLVLLVIVGLCDVIHSLWMLMLKSPSPPRKILLCFLDGSYDRLILSRLTEKQKWHGNEYADSIVAVTGDSTDSDIIAEFREKGVFFINGDEYTDKLLNLGVLDGHKEDQRYC